VTHYLDLGFLLGLVARAPGSASAWELVRKLPQPIPLTALFEVEPSAMGLFANQP
jgi:hypothetical protein